MTENYPQRLKHATGADEIFEIVKDAVRDALNRERAGLMIGLTDLGIAQQGFIGGFYQGGSNAIILNNSVLKRISKAKPEALKPYAFSVILHEYLHTLGVLDEARTRLLTYKITSDLFGEDHLVTRLSKDFNAMAKEILSNGGPEPPGPPDITFVDGLDRQETTYIG